MKLGKRTELLNNKIILFQIIIFFNIFLFVSPLLFAASSDDFVITVKTDNPGDSSDNQFEIPTYSGETYNYNVDCDNDGYDDAIGVTDNFTCNYATSGTYTIRIEDNTGAGNGFPRIYFNFTGDAKKLLSVNQWGTGHWISMNHAFAGCSNLNSASAIDNGGGAVPDWATDSPNLSNVTDMSYMFWFASSFNQDITHWDVSNITNMTFALGYASSFNQDISGWNVSNVTNMLGMLDRASSFNQDISGWDVSNVTNMKRMFLHASSFNQNIGDWNVSNVTNMTDMLSNSGISTDNYDNTLIGWSSKSLQNNVQLDSSAHYCMSEAERQHIIDTYNWTINDAGKSCSPQSDPTSAPDMTDATDTGISNSDDITSDNTPTFEVTCSVINDNITLYVDNVSNAIYTCSAVGTTEITANPALIDGNHNITYTDTNYSGESGHSPALTIIIDTVSPAEPTINTPTKGSPVTGTAESGATVVVTTPSGSTCTATSDASGNYSCVLSPAPVNGEDVTAVATDEAGNSSNPVTVTGGIDTVAPAEPTINTPTKGSPVTGTAESGATVVVTTPSGSTCTATADASNNYSCVLSPTPVNGEDVTAVATDEAGNSSNPITVTGGIDTSVPSDSDNDGIADNIEDNVPGGDGNGDGTPDRLQADVRSLPAGASDGYITIESPSNCPMTHVNAIAEPNNPADTNYDFPYGLVEFRLYCSSANVKIFYHGASSLTGYTYRKYGPTPQNFNAASWYTLPNVTYGTSNINGNVTAYAEFTLIDGGLGDDTGADGVIVDQGGPALPAATGGNADTTPVPTMSEWGMILTGLFILFASFVMIGRKKENE